MLVVNKILFLFIISSSLKFAIFTSKINIMKTFYTLFILVFALTNVKSQSGTFQSIATGNWAASSTWTQTAGSDADGIPDGDDNLTITTHTVKLASGANNTCKSLTIDASGVLDGNNGKLVLKGNFTNNGFVIKNMSVVVQANCTFSSASTFTNTGEIRVTGGTLTFAPGTVLNKKGNINLQISGTKIINNGSITLNVGSPVGKISGVASTSWTNAAGSYLKISADVTGSTVFNFTAATNTVVYAGSCATIVPTTYNSLEVISNTAKTLNADLNVTGNFLFSGSTNSLDVNGNTINVGGNFTHSSGTIDFESSGSKVIFNNSSAATQVVSGAAVTRFYDLEIDNPGGSVSFTSFKRVINDLIMTNGNCNSNTDRLILTSDANATAAIAAITNTANVSFSGSMVVEKFIDDMFLDGGFGGSPVGGPVMSYDLSSPVSNSTVNDWDNEMYLSGIGDYDGIGGPAGVDGTTPAGFNSMYTYAETTNTFVTVTGSGTSLAVAKGYQILMADDQGNSQWNAKTIDTRGLPNYGDITLSGLTRTAGQGLGWHLVGNPYASAIDYNLTTKTNVSNNVYFTDQGNYSNWFTTFGDRILPAHQGFYLEANSGSIGGRSVKFTESCKVSDHTTFYHRKKPVYDIKLVLSSALTPYSHENHIIFDSNAKPGFDEDLDASYRKFPAAIAPAIYMKDNVANRGIITNYMDTKAEEVVIPLEIFTPKTGVYYIDAVALNTEGYKTIWIENVKTGDKYEIGNPAAVEGKEMATNFNYVLRMSKTVKPTIIEKEENNVLVFATENTLNVKSVGQDQTINELKVYDMAGKLVLSQSNISISNTDAFQVDISHLTAGIYVVSTTNADLKTKNSKIVK